MATEHLVQHDAKRIDVRLLRVLLFLQNLRSHVRGRANARHGAGHCWPDDGRPKISHFAAPMLVDQEVVQLHVSVEHTLAVEVFSAFIEKVIEKTNAMALTFLKQLQ